jgi:hypothetical protein
MKLDQNNKQFIKFCIVYNCQYFGDEEEMFICN